jgi:ABC-type transporter Mla subunit MlaD
MADQVELLLSGGAGPLDSAAVQGLHDRIRAAVERAAATADEAARERRSYITDAPDPDPLVRTLRRASHDLIIIARALSAPLSEAVAARMAEPIAATAAALSAALNDTGAALARRSAPPDLTAVAGALAAVEAELAALRRDGATLALPEDAVERLFGLAFGFEQIGRNLGELAARVAELTERG